MAFLCGKDKTIGMLFKGAKISGVELPPENQKDLTKLLILSGDGEIDLLYHEKAGISFKMRMSI